MPFGDIPCQIALLQRCHLPIFMMPCLPVMPIVIIEIPVIRLRCIRIRHGFIKLNILVIWSVIMIMVILHSHSFPGWWMVYVITWPYIYQPFLPLMRVVFSVFHRRCVICRILPRFPRNHTFLKHSNVKIIDLKQGDKKLIESVFFRIIKLTLVIVSGLFIFRHIFNGMQSCFMQTPRSNIGVKFDPKNIKFEFSEDPLQRLNCVLWWISNLKADHLLKIKMTVNFAVAVKIQPLGL